MWQSIRNWFSNSFRYVIIATLFLFLLTMVILLNEIMAFHDRIASVVGEDARARRVVLMLNQIHEHPERYPEGEEQLPIGALAVQLGKLQAAHADLARFREPRLQGGSAPTQIASSAPAGSSEETQRLLASLEGHIQNLHKAVTGAAPEVAIRGNVVELQQALAEFKNVQETSGQTIGADGHDRSLQALLDKAAGLRSAVVTAIPEVTARLALVNVQQALEQLAGAPEPSYLAFVGQLETMQLDLQSLQQGVAVFPGANLLAERLERLESSVKQMRQPPIPDSPQSEFAANLQTMQQELSELERTIPFDPLTTALAKPTTDLARAIEELRQQFAGQTVEKIERSTGAIDKALEDRFQRDYRLAATVVDNIRELRTRASTLGLLQPTTYATADGRIETGESAEDRYAKLVADFKADLDELEQSLGARSRVIALANVLEEDANETAASAAAKADGILQDFDALNRFTTVLMPFSWWLPPSWPIAQFGVHPQRTATLTTDSIATVYIFMIGAIGSLIYITKYQLKMAIEGHWLGSAPTRPLPWLLFRPFFGVVVAFAVYLLVRAGQLAFGANGDGVVGTDLNIPILSVVALFAGLLAWQALAAIESRGQAWFSSQTRRPLWASGLDQALRTSERTIAECAHQVGRSSEQVERWLLFRDMVPVELQDRIRTWLDKPLDELFGEDKPSDKLGGKPMWAVGLKAALDNRDLRLDADALVELLREERRPENRERIQKWIELKLQVSPAMQWRLVDLLDVPHHKLFAPALQDREVWGLCLRRAIEDRKERAQQIADRLGLNVASVHAWKELDEAVPTALQDRLMTTLEREFSTLFEPGPAEPDWLLPATGLAGALRHKYGTLDDAARQNFAHEVDVEPARVEAWLRDKPIARDTRATILRVLPDATDLFKPRLLSSAPADDAGGEAAADANA